MLGHRIHFDDFESGTQVRGEVLSSYEICLIMTVTQFVSGIYYPIPPIPVTAITFEVGFSFFATINVILSISSERPISSLDNLNSLPS